MDYMTVKDAAVKWGYSEATIRKWCKNESIFFVCKPKKINGHWQIPAQAECPRMVKK